MENQTKATIDYRILSIFLMPAIPLHFMLVKNLTHPLHSKCLSPSLKEIM